MDQLNILKSVAIPIIGLGLYGYDIYGDILIATKYWYGRETTAEFTWTVVFIILPALIIMCMDISWVSKDYKLWDVNIDTGNNSDELTANFNQEETISENVKTAYGNQENLNQPTWTCTYTILAKIGVFLSVISFGILGRKRKAADSHELTVNLNQEETANLNQEETTNLNQEETILDIVKTADGNQEKQNQQKWTGNDKKLAYIRVFLSFISLGILGRIWRVAEFLYQYMKSVVGAEESRYHFKNEARNRELDSAYLNLMEAFFESAPQLMIQLYITFKVDELGNREIPLIGSLLSITWAYTSYYRLNRAVAGDGEFDIPLQKSPFYILSVLACLTTRFACVIYSAVGVHLALPIVIGVVHTFFCFLWIYCKQPNLDGILVSESCPYLRKFVTCERSLYHILFACIQFVLFFNIEPDPVPGKVGRQQQLFYGIMHVENLIMILSIVFFTEPTSTARIVIGVASAGILINVLSLYIHYTCCHPSAHKYMENETDCPEPDGVETTTLPSSEKVLTSICVES